MTKETFHITTLELGVDADFARSFTTEATNHRDALQDYVEYLNARPLITPWTLEDFQQMELEDDQVLVHEGTTMYDASDSNTKVYVIISEAAQQKQI